MEQQPYDVFNEITSGGVFSKAWQIMKDNFLDVLLIVVILFAIQMPLNSFNDESGYFSPFLGGIYYILFYGPVKYGVALAFLHVVRGNKFSPEPLLSVFKGNYVNIFLASILTSFIIGIGIVLLIVPGIIFAVRLAFVPYLTTEKRMDAVTAIKTSWEMTRPHAWTIFFMGLLCIPIVLGGILVLGVGVVVSVMWIGVAFALVYQQVSQKQNPSGTSIMQE
jgi:uncharacterized membrane protein